MTQGFAVLDFETTGLRPERGDRVVEVGVVLANHAGEIEHEWTTLVNPERDIGASHIHGIRVTDVLDAPTFSEISDHLATLVAHRTLVAHNATFDMRFLHAELLRLGVELADRPSALCTMRWAGQVIGAAKLQHCCEAVGIDLDDAHTALADARATAQLVAHLVRIVGLMEEWLVEVARGTSPVWTIGSDSRTVPRVHHRGMAVPDPYAWLRSVLSAAWIPGDPQDEAAYMLMLDRALLDRSISHTEGRELLEIAQRGGLTRETVTRLHHDYLRSIAQEALADDVVSADERADLEAVAAALGFGAPFVDEAIDWATKHRAPLSASTFALAPGDRVVFTGEMRRSRDEWVATILAAGLVSGGVTKSTKVVVTADPDSMSGKAAKARSYGIPVVDEDAFHKLFEVYAGV